MEIHPLNSAGDMNLQSLHFKNDKLLTNEVKSIKQEAILQSKFLIRELVDG